MDGNTRPLWAFWIDEICVLCGFSPPCVLDSGSPFRNDGAETYVDSDAFVARLGRILNIKLAQECHARS